MTSVTSRPPVNLLFDLPTVILVNLDMNLSRIGSLLVTTVRHHAQWARVTLAWLIGASGLPAHAAAAAPVVFTVDSTSSVITQSGSITISGLTFPLLEQGSGSLTTHYAGTLLVNLTPPRLQFPGGSTIMALTNGIWQPAAGGATGAEFGNVGAKINISLGLLGSGTCYLAGRNLKLDLASPTLTLTNSRFDASALTVSYITNSPPAPRLDFRLTGTGLVTSTNGSSPLAGTFTNSAAMAYLTNAAGRLKLVIPVNVTNQSQFMSPNDTTTILKGQIIATAPSSVWPFAATIAINGGQVTLTWPSVAGQSFAVQVSPDLRTWSNAPGTPLVNGDLTTWSASLTDTPQFYRVQLQ